MKLSRFIADNLGTTLVEWEMFARTLLPAATGMTKLALRGHAAPILQEAVKAIETPQSQKEQPEKSKGSKPADSESGASKHGIERHSEGFSLIQLVAEFRALRATVIRLWEPQITECDKSHLDDMLRFNEAIDQALADSVVAFAEQTVRTRNTFLGVLGHDLRAPLAAMSMAGDFLAATEAGRTRTAEIGRQMQRVTANMTGMVNDLLEYVRTQRGDSMPIVPKNENLENVWRAAIHDASAAHPDCPFELTVSGDLNGEFDDARLQQVITHLLTNAAQHRAKEHPMKLRVAGEPELLTVQVKNMGPVIPSESLRLIFNPLVQFQGDAHEEQRPTTSLGLGLFIAR